MKPNAFTFAVFALPSLLFGAQIAIAAGPQLVVAIPERIIDGDPLVATVTLTNASKMPLRITEMQTMRNLHASVRRIEAYPSGKCVAQEHFTPAMAGRRTILLASGDSTTTQLDVAAEYPFGLEPGRYELSVIFDGIPSVTSRPVRFEVALPTAGPAAAAYREFTQVCAALKSRQEGAAAAALVFAEHNRAFPYSRALLNYARIDATGEPRLAIDDLLVRNYPDSREAQAASADRDRLLKREVSLKSYDAYLARYSQELGRPENAGAAGELQQLSSITHPDDFERYEAFLSRHPHSFFNDDVLHRMIVAIDEGILPPGRTRADAGRLRRELLAKLLTVSGYWAQKARSEM
ncbi:MAG TPA: hypothetical protein VHX14_00840 [Thermoanaerobaculia bacterium]|jgi:hypothetical protein|nr:hypothetical protein [Thermoanaerobaculia bacterium]